MKLVLNEEIRKLGEESHGLFFGGDDTHVEGCQIGDGKSSERRIVWKGELIISVMPLMAIMKRVPLSGEPFGCEWFPYLIYYFIEFHKVRDFGQLTTFFL